MKKISLILLTLLVLMPTMAFSQRKTNRGDKKPSTYTLSVSSNVNGASVQISGKQKASGKAPYSAKLAEGTYEVRVSASGYKTKTTKVSLTKNQSIRMNLEAETYRLSVNTNVKDARINLSGPLSASSNGSASWNVPRGNYEVEVSAKGYQSKRVKVSVTGNKSVDVNLAQATFRLSVNTNVKDAKINVTGPIEATANGSLSWDAPMGDYIVDVSAEGYSSKTVKVSLTQDRSISVELEKSMVNLSISVNVSDCDIAVRNVNGKGSWTSMGSFNSNLNRGRYEVAVVSPGYNQYVETVTISKDTNLKVTLTPAMGQVIIMPVNSRNMKELEPENFRVYDNGTLLPEDFTYQFTPGQHTIQIVSGAFMAQTTINIEAGKTYNIQPKLEIYVNK